MVSARKKKNSSVIEVNHDLPQAPAHQPEVLTVDNIEIVYDMSDEITGNYRGDSNKWPKIMNIFGFVVALLLFGIQIPQPSSVSCFLVENAPGASERACGLKFVQFIAVIVITVTQVVAMVPVYVWPIITTIIRLMQISGLLLIKFQIHRYLHGDPETLKPGHVGYAILSACVAAACTTDLPGNVKRERRFYTTIILVLAGIAAVMEIGLNINQSIVADDVLIAVGTGVIPYVVVAVVFFFLNIWEKYGSVGKSIFFTFLTGHIGLMYATLPGLHFNNIGIQLGLYLFAFTIYGVIFTTYQYYRFH